MTCIERPVLFISRGKGRGHAVPDSTILRRLLQLCPSIDVAVASYSLGGQTLRELGWDVLDLELPEDPSPWDVAIKIIALIKKLSPRLIITHEEFSASPVAAAFNLPNIVLTDWLPRQGSSAMQCLVHCDHVIFLDEPGYYDIAEPLRKKTVYSGPIVRQIEGGTSTRLARRRALSLPDDALVIVGIPGGARHSSEAESPLFDLVHQAFEQIPRALKYLVWVVGTPDAKDIADRVNAAENVRIIEPHLNLLDTIAAADLVITKGNRITTMECYGSNCPSISISYGANPIDDYRVGRIPTNTPLRARALDSDLLCKIIIAKLSEQKYGDMRPPSWSDGASKVAEWILQVAVHGVIGDGSWDPAPTELLASMVYGSVRR